MSLDLKYQVKVWSFDLELWTLIPPDVHLSLAVQAQI